MSADRRGCRRTGPGPCLHPLSHGGLDQWLRRLESWRRTVGAVAASTPAFVGRARECQALDRMLDGARRGESGVLVIRKKVSRQDLAKMVGASREMVSRVMKDLEERGFVQTQPDGSMIVKERLSSLT